MSHSDIGYHVQTIAHDVDEPAFGRRSTQSIRDLKEIHPDLPALVVASTGILKQNGIDLAQSKTTSSRLGDTLAREITEHGPAPMTEAQRNQSVFYAMRSTLIQEAAGGYIEEKTGKPEPLRSFAGDKSPAFGQRAENLLLKSGINLRGNLLENMGTETGKDADGNDRDGMKNLRALSIGAYNRLPPYHHRHVAKALDHSSAQLKPHKDMEYAAPREARVPLAQPVDKRPGRPIAGQAVFTRAQPQRTFGRKTTMAAVQQAHAAGQGIS